jgi:hypothetical protein
MVELGIAGEVTVNAGHLTQKEVRVTLTGTPSRVTAVLSHNRRIFKYATLTPTISGSTVVLRLPGQALLGDCVAWQAYGIVS